MVRQAHHEVYWNFGGKLALGIETMQIGSILAVFFVIWWLCFVAVLPIGHKSQAEVGQVIAGTDPGAPVAPQLGRKVLLATVLGVIFTALLLWGLTNETLHHYWNR